MHSVSDVFADQDARLLESMSKYTYLNVLAVLASTFLALVMMLRYVGAGEYFWLLYFALLFIVWNAAINSMGLCLCVRGIYFYFQIKIKSNQKQNKIKLN